jgi:hypothetical protein
MRRTFGVAVAPGRGLADGIPGGAAVGDGGTGVWLASGVIETDGEGTGVLVRACGGVAARDGVGAAAKAPLAITPPTPTTSRKTIAVPIAHRMSRSLLATPPL